MSSARFYSANNCKILQKINILRQRSIKQLDDSHTHIQRTTGKHAHRNTSSSAVQPFTAAFRQATSPLLFITAPLPDIQLTAIFIRLKMNIYYFTTSIIICQGIYAIFCFPRLTKFMKSVRIKVVQKKKRLKQC